MKKIIIIVVLLNTINTFSQEKDILVPYLKDGKYGYANKDGKIIIQEKYESALPFYKSYDLSSAFNGKRSLVINRKGKAILKGGTDNIPEDSISRGEVVAPYLPPICAIDNRGNIIKEKVGIIELNSIYKFQIFRFEQPRYLNNLIKMNNLSREGFRYTEFAQKNGLLV